MSLTCKRVYRSTSFSDQPPLAVIAAERQPEGRRPQRLAPHQAESTSTHPPGKPDATCLRIHPGQIDEPASDGVFDLQRVVLRSRWDHVRKMARQSPFLLGMTTFPQHAHKRSSASRIELLLESQLHKFIRTLGINRTLPINKFSWKMAHKSFVTCQASSKAWCIPLQFDFPPPKALSEVHKSEKVVLVVRQLVQHRFPQRRAWAAPIPPPKEGLQQENKNNLMYCESAVADESPSALAILK